jgi:hypothetical protein
MFAKYIYNRFRWHALRHPKVGGGAINIKMIVTSTFLKCIVLHLACSPIENLLQRSWNALYCIWRAARSRTFQRSWSRTLWRAAGCIPYSVMRFNRPQQIFIFESSHNIFIFEWSHNILVLGMSDHWPIFLQKLVREPIIFERWG